MALRVDICSQEPTTYTEATDTYSLGNKDPVDEGSPGTIAEAFSDGTITGTGTATHWAVTTDSNELVKAGALVSSVAVSGSGTFSCSEIDLTLEGLDINHPNIDSMSDSLDSADIFQVTVTVPEAATASPTGGGVSLELLRRLKKNGKLRLWHPVQRDPGDETDADTPDVVVIKPIGKAGPGLVNQPIKAEKTEIIQFPRDEAGESAFRANVAGARTRATLNAQERARILEQQEQDAIAVLLLI